MSRHVFDDKTAWFLLSRSFRYLLTFVLVVVLSFLIPRFMPGDPVVNLLGGDHAYISSEAMQNMRMELGLEKPLYLQFLIYLNSLLQGDWGKSFHYAQPILPIICYRLQWTLVLMIPSIILGAALGTVLGSLAGWRKGGQFDIIMSSLLLLLYSTPGYWLAMLFALILGFYLNLLPFYGMTSSDSVGLERALDILRHMILPASVLTIYKAAHNYLIARGSIIQVSEEGYILTARAKGLGENAVLFKHVLKNAMLPLATSVAMDFGFMLSGTILVEIVFSWNGMGTLVYDSVVTRDYPMLNGCLIIISICVIISNLLVDFFYYLLDPRIRGGEII
ncbi:MAG: ABC transporter permease [Methanotrichaceae archaeon]